MLTKTLEGKRKWVGHRWTNNVIIASFSSFARVSERDRPCLKIQSLPFLKYPYSFAWEGAEEDHLTQENNSVFNDHIPSL